jgi:superfamily II DNA or RNA helicase
MQIKHTAGIYIAHHPWLDQEYGPNMLFKVGCSQELERRIHDGSYTTCFPPGWRYMFTFETDQPAACRLLEELVLAAFDEKRLGGRELVNAPLDDIIALAIAVAEEYQITGQPRYTPTYDKPARAVTDTLDRTIRMKRDIHCEAIVKCLIRAQGIINEPLAVKNNGHAVDKITKTAEDEEDLALTGFAEEIEEEMLTENGGLTYVERCSLVATSKLREYQTEAVEKSCTELDINGRCILQMACRSGKTNVAASIIRRFATGRVLYLVPNLPLLHQTTAKLAAFIPDVAASDFLLVGSDGKVAIRVGETARMSTDPEEIASSSAKIIVSTYQSSPLVPSVFDLEVYDECHHIVSVNGKSAFSNFIMRERGQTKRLFLTATPRYEPISKFPTSMNNTELYGQTAYRYHLRQAIDGGYVNDFSLSFVGMDVDTPHSLRSAVSSMEGSPKLLVYCQNIKHSELLMQQAKDSGLFEDCDMFVAHSKQNRESIKNALRGFCNTAKTAIMFNCRLFQEGVEIPELNGVFFATPRHSPRDIVQSVCRPLNKLEGKPVSRVFLPVAFDPQYGAESMENVKKYASIVPFVEAMCSEDPRLYEYLMDSGKELPADWVGAATGLGASELLAAVRKAIRAGKPACERGDLDQKKVLMNAKVPWELAFAELKRTVELCHRMPKTSDLWTPGKLGVGTDYKFYSWYKWVREAYAANVKWLVGKKAGKPTAQPKNILEPYQLADLRSLNNWEEYGVEGPFPMERCMKYLDDWYTQRGELPPINVADGGFPGFNATEIERLSGLMIQLNQQDGHKKMVVTPRLVTLLDAFCDKHKLRWRKERDAKGHVIRDATKKYCGHATFLTAAADNFRALCKERDANGKHCASLLEHYPDYGTAKFKNMEDLDVLARKVAPPKETTLTDEQRTEKRAARDAKFQRRLGC